MKRKDIDIFNGNDAVFLPGKIHGCEDEICIIYYNAEAQNGSGCWEIEIIDKQRILTVYEAVDGNPEEFFATLPDYFHGEWLYCNRDMETFNGYSAAYCNADFITGEDGTIDDELDFLVRWAST